jgi:hypothetical protein
MKTEFNKNMAQAIDALEKRMLASIQAHIGKIMQTSDAAVLQMETKSNEITDRIIEMIQSKNMMPLGDSTTPCKKQQRTSNVDVKIHDDEEMANPITPASRESRTQYGTDKSAGERK